MAATSFALEEMAVKANAESRTSRVALWAGRIITVVMAAFLLFDGAVKVLNLKIAMDARPSAMGRSDPRALMTP